MVLTGLAISRACNTAMDATTFSHVGISHDIFPDTGQFEMAELLASKSDLLIFIKFC
jgi:hypothetical protein